jgi:hypothetical protein
MVTSRLRGRNLTSSICREWFLGLLRRRGMVHGDRHANQDGDYRDHYEAPGHSIKLVIS